VKKTAAALLSLLFLTGISTATVTSVDSITYNSNNEFFDGDVFAIQVASDQSTDKIDVFLGSSKLEESTEGEVTQDLEIDFTDQSTELRFPTTGSSDLREIHTFDPYTNAGYPSEEAAIDAGEQQCAELVEYQELGTVITKYDVSTFSWGFYCFQVDQYLGTPAYIDDPEEIFSTNVQLQASGKEPLTKTLSNGDTGSGRVTDLGRHAKIVWNGNLDTGASEPNVGRVYALQDNDYTGSWRIISQEAYNDYEREIENNAKDAIEAWAAGEQTKWQAVDYYNDVAWDAAEVDTSSDLAYTTVADSSSGVFSYDTEDLLSYPMFTVYVDAGENGYIEVSKPTGEPSIVSSDGGEVNEIGGGTVDVTVRNSGDGEGSFSARLTECSDGFTFSDAQRTKQGIQPGETVSYSFHVSFQSTSGSTQEISGTCSIEVEDTGSGASDSTTVSLTGVQVSQCSPVGKEKYDINEQGIYEIYVCPEDQQGWEYDRSCDAGEKVEYYTENGVRKAECVEDPNPPCDSGDCPPPTTWWEKLIDFLTPDTGDGILGQIHLAFSLIAGALAGMIGYRGSRWVDGEYQVRGSFKPLKKRSISRVDKGRLPVGVVGGILAFIAATWAVLQIPLLVQLLVIAGTGAVKWKTPL
jgi:hypothetical protein